MMTIPVTDNDIAVLNALLKDGRKSFRQISREIGLSTPAVKSRFDRLLNMGIIKSVSPILDLEKLVRGTNNGNIENTRLDTIIHNSQHAVIKSPRTIKKDDGLGVKISCDYCKIPLFVKMFALKFANFERYFCCKECRIAYKKKYSGRIEALRKRHLKNQDPKNL